MTTNNMYLWDQVKDPDTTLSDKAVKSRRALKQSAPHVKAPEQLELPLTTPEIDVNFDMQVATLG